MAGCVKQDTSSIPKQSNNNFTQRSNYGNYSEQQKKLVKFLNNKMLTNQGIYTNYSQQSYMASEARGHELLSESSGLWLQYLTTREPDDSMIEVAVKSLKAAIEVEETAKVETKNDDTIDKQDLNDLKVNASI